MTVQTLESRAETEIRERIDAWAQAVRDHDLGRLVAFYLPDVRAFDAADGLQVRGADAYGEAWAKGFDCLRGGRMVFQLAELEVVAAGDVGFASAMVRCGGCDRDGNEQACWMRYTGCWRRQGGGWLVAHEHFSAPFGMEGMKALLDLTP